eukprot:358781-Chlamydomonas_euryale.AAC.2
MGLAICTRSDLLGLIRRLLFRVAAHKVQQHATCVVVPRTAAWGTCGLHATHHGTLGTTRCAQDACKQHSGRRPARANNMPAQDRRVQTTCRHKT